VNVRLSRAVFKVPGPVYIGQITKYPAAAAAGLCFDPKCSLGVSPFLGRWKNLLILYYFIRTKESPINEQDINSIFFIAILMAVTGVTVRYQKRAQPFLSEEAAPK
jgi:hypothetical protein